MERRDSEVEFEIRAVEGPKPGKVSGYAAVFDKLSADLGGYRERMAPYAFDGITNGADIRIFWNHDSSQVLGRTRSGTARVAPDTQGLHFEVDMPDTTYARDIWTALERGDVSGASIGFFIGDEKWSTDEAGYPVRTITRVSELVECSLCAIPAYPDTSLAVSRSKIFDTDAAKAFLDRQKAESEARARLLKMVEIGA